MACSPFHRVIRHITGLFSIFVILLLAPCAWGYGYEADNLIDAIKQGETGLLFRLRHEDAKETGLLTGKATTLRSQLKYATQDYYFLKGTVELIDVSSFLGGRYNSTATEVGRVGYARIPDPKGTGLSLANIQYQGLQNSTFILGRQSINLDNQRFIGSENFRQFPQSFDAFSAQVNALEYVDAYYAYLDHVNTILGNGRSNDVRRQLQSHLFQLGWSGFQYGYLGLHAYLLKDRDAPLNSNATYGVRIHEDQMMRHDLGINYALEADKQDQYKNNPTHYHAWRLLAEIGKEYEEILGARFGYEKLSGKKGSTNKQFRTPFASLHEFQGMADVFNTTPDRGIQDTYIKLEGHTSLVHLMGAYHLFRFGASGAGGNSAGHEWDVEARLAFNEHLDFSLAYARYRANTQSTLPNTSRLWATVCANFL